MSVNYRHIRMHLAHARAEFDRGTPVTVALTTIKLLIDRQQQADSQTSHQNENEIELDHQR